MVIHVSCCTLRLVWSTLKGSTPIVALCANCVKGWLVDVEYPLREVRSYQLTGGVPFGKSSVSQCGLWSRVSRGNSVNSWGHGVPHGGKLMSCSIPGHCTSWWESLGYCIARVWQCQGLQYLVVGMGKLLVV